MTVWATPPWQIWWEGGGHILIVYPLKSTTMMHRDQRAQTDTIQKCLSRFCKNQDKHQFNPPHQRFVLLSWPNIYALMAPKLGSSSSTWKVPSGSASFYSKQIFHSDWRAPETDTFHTSAAQVGSDVIEHRVAAAREWTRVRKYCSEDSEVEF